MEFPKQFALAARPLNQLSGWKHCQLQDWWLSVARDVPVLKVFDERGGLLSLLIGWVIFRGRLLHDGDSITAHRIEHGAPDVFDELCGRFVCFSVEGEEVLVRPDPAAMMGVVYNPGQQILASTPTMLSLLEEQQPDPEVRRALSGGKGEVWFPLGLTPYLGVKRLLPNHTLGLNSWQAKRVFPLPGGEGRCGNPDVEPRQAIARIGELIRSNVKALVDDGHRIAQLTGGRDSRIVLAASREWHQQMQFQTVVLDRYCCRLDCHIAADIARRFDLNYRQLPFLEPSKEELAGWLHRVGYCVEDTVASMGKTARVHDSHSHEINGTCGEALRAPYWYTDDARLTRLSSAGLLMRMGIVRNPYTLALAEKWLAGLPEGMSVANVLGLAYTEIRAAGWAGPTLYGHELSLPSISPFNCGDYYREILALPEEYRGAKKVIPALMDYLWPELGRIPFNRAQGLGKLFFLRQEIRLALSIKMRDRIKYLIQPLGLYKNPLRRYLT
ncbi:hypothetical protein [Microbulbifer guangxiensis]|uniref:hypothetical protein n=1 Tax=Microbulbifer guangxiensis TaxID=2904249 RepID=UPI001F263372|nr:hypothetical protein [Microbulbifer guangxiensis]